MVSKKSSRAEYGVSGLSLKDGHAVAAILQGRLHALNDLQLTSKHAHWNVVGRDSIGVHEMLDPQIELVRAMIDKAAERMATLGVSPNGLPGALVKERTWEVRTGPCLNQRPPGSFGRRLRRRRFKPPRCPCGCR